MWMEETKNMNLVTLLQWRWKELDVIRKPYFQRSSSNCMSHSWVPNHAHLCQQV